MLKHCLIVLITLLLSSSSILASSLQKTYNVINFPTSKVRDQHDVKAITQDSHGFIWFASNTGLFRFDGLNVKKYSLQTTNDDSPTVVKSLLIDSNNKLWVGTNKHLLIFDKKSETFHQVELKNDGPSFAILNLLEDHKNNIWVGTRDNGLFKIEQNLTNNNSVYHFHKTAKHSLKISSNQIRSLYQANDDELWIGTKDGLSRYSYIDKRISHHKIDIPSSVQKKLTIYSILKLKNNLLLGSNIGLIKVNRSTYSGSLYSTDNSLASLIYSVKYTHDNNLIIGSKFNGLMIIEPKTKEIIKLNNNQGQGSELNSNMVFTTFSDILGNIWLGTRVGINKVTYSGSSVDLYRSKDNSAQCIASNENHAILFDSQNNIWLGAKGKGLNFIDQTNGICKLFNATNINLSNITLETILDIKEDLGGNIWIASFNEGLIKYNPNKNVFSQLSFSDLKNTHIIQQGKITDIFVDKDNNLWLGMIDHGLVKYNQKNNTLESFDKNTVKNLQVNKLAVKSIEKIGDTLWLGTAFAGLISYNEITGQIKSYQLDNQNLRIVTTSLDNQQNIWIGTRNNGIIKFTPTTGEYIHYQDKDGLAHNNIFDIQVDNNKLWIGTYNGLSMFDQQEQLFTNYYEKDGMQSNDSSLGSFFDEKTGNLWLGGMNGINRIDTNTLTKKDESSSLYLTSLKINGEKVEVNNNKTASPLKENIISAQQLTLTHKENNFAFSFANINYLNTDKLSYQYRLAGYDNWSDVARENLSANYTNIPAGEYKFQVRVTGNSGLWDSDETSITLIILPPWWLTTFALIIYSLLILTSIYLVIHFRTQALRTKAVELERSVQQRTIELAQEKDKVEQLLEQKNEEFANLSHEFRTPLTLILGTSSQLLKPGMEDTQLNRIEVIKRNGYRLLRMVDQLLNIETFRVKAISQKSLQYTGNIIRQLVDAFTDLAFEKGIKLQVINIEDIDFELVDDALEKIVVNLLSNAIKYTSNGGSITLETKRTLNNELYIQIVDTGIGIPSNQLDSVFEKYKRVLSKESEQITGAGIGLALIKELIISHNGSISLTSELGSGTTITVLLPIINEGQEKQQENVIPKNEQIDNIVAMELMSLTQQTTLLPIKNSPSLSSSAQDEKIRILIIEDNPDMNQYMADCLANNYIVHSAFDGLEGVNLAIKEVPDLIISDIMMPILDGYQATQKIRENPVTNHIPIILLTSRHDLESKLKGWHHQVDEYLTKPFNVEELKIRIENLLAIRNLLKSRNNQKTLKSPHIEQGLLDKFIDTASVEQINKQDVFIEKLNQTLEKQYTNTSTTVNTVAKDMAMSERQLFRKLKSVLGVTPTDYLRRFRLEQACLLLAQGQSAINTAFDTGFSSQSYFSKCFKSEYGCTPSDFQKQLLVEEPPS